MHESSITVINMFFDLNDIGERNNDLLTMSVPARKVMLMSALSDLVSHHLHTLLLLDLISLDILITS